MVEAASPPEAETLLGNNGKAASAADSSGKKKAKGKCLTYTLVTVVVILAALLVSYKVGQYIKASNYVNNSKSSENAAQKAIIEDAPATTTITPPQPVASVAPVTPTPVAPSKMMDKILKAASFGAVRFIEKSKKEKKKHGKFSVQVNGYMNSGSEMSDAMLTCMSEKICSKTFFAFNSSYVVKAEGENLGQDCLVVVDPKTQGYTIKDDPASGKTFDKSAPTPNSFTLVSGKRRIRVGDFKCSHGLLAIGGLDKVEKSERDLALEKRTEWNCVDPQYEFIPVLRQCFASQLRDIRDKIKAGESELEAKHTINYGDCVPEEWLEEPKISADMLTPMRVLLAHRSPVDALAEMGYDGNEKEAFIEQQMAMIIFRYVVYRKMEEAFPHRFELFVSDYEKMVENPAKHFTSTFKSLLNEASISHKSIHQAADTCSALIDQIQGTVKESLEEDRSEPVSHDALKALAWKMMPADKALRKELLGSWGAGLDEVPGLTIAELISLAQTEYYL